MVLVFIVIAIVATVSSHAQEYIVTNDTSKCVNDMLEWCTGMKYPDDGAGLSMTAVTIVDQDDYFRALCTTDSEGTNCTRKGSPWFECSNQNQLSYKGQPLTTDGGDDEVCKTADWAFNELFVQKMTYDNTTLTKEIEHGVESFFEILAKMQEKIEALQSRMFNMGMFGVNFPFGKNDPSTTITDESTGNTSPEDSQLERE